MTAVGGVERQLAQLRQALEPGDEITSDDEGAVVALTCPGGSDMKLHGRFRAVIMPVGPGQDCALDLLAGGGDVLTNRATQVSSGETLMGSRRTQYSMRVARDGERSTIECVVFEGNVDVINRRINQVVPLATSMKLSIRDGQGQQREPVSPRDIQTAALVYSRADVARARALGSPLEDPRSLQRVLEAKYVAVLTKPEDPAPRIELAILQTGARMSAQALYQLDKAESLNPILTQQQVAIAATKFDVYKQTGREQEAAAEGEKLRRLDPQIYKMKVGRVEASRAGATIVLSAAATPSTVRRGEPTVISVRATTHEGRPVVRAKVVVSAGGGMFRQSRQTQMTGATDANGAFSTQWLCTACAPQYRIDVEVIATNFPPQKTTIDVTIR